MHEQHKQLGQWGEQIAATYLRRRGYQLLARGWHCREGELDIVAYDPGVRTLTFVEVKTRRSIRFGSPEESISGKKLRSLEAAASRYLAAVGYRGPVRFDLIGITIRPGIVRLHHLHNMAFD